MNNKTAVIIPAFNPDQRLFTLVTELLGLGLTHIVVVDDGSHAASTALFCSLDRLGIPVLHHAVNRGKGAALKSGIRFVCEKMRGVPGMVTADADGQHQATDILRVAQTLAEHPDALVLGVRHILGNPAVPRKSRFGNRFSAAFFRLTTGVSCPDTQTGLRGFSMRYADFALSIPGSRYEYEMNFLTTAASTKIPLLMLPVQTVYFDNNQATHFRPIVDSYRVYQTPLKFVAASLISALADLSIFTLLTRVLSAQVVALVLIATVAARLVSGTLNFGLNKLWSFNNRGYWGPQAMRYTMLFIAVMLTSWGLVSALSFLPLPLTAIKICVDGALFVASYIAQRRWVFAESSPCHKRRGALVKDTGKTLSGSNI